MERCAKLDEMRLTEVGEDGGEGSRFPVVTIRQARSLKSSISVGLHGLENCKVIPLRYGLSGSAKVHDGGRECNRVSWEPDHFCELRQSAHKPTGRSDVRRGERRGWGHGGYLRHFRLFNQVDWATSWTGRENQRQRV